MPNLSIDITKRGKGVITVATSCRLRTLHKISRGRQKPGTSWVGHVARMEIMHPTFCSKNSERKPQCEGSDWGILLNVTPCSLVSSDKPFVAIVCCHFERLLQHH